MMKPPASRSRHSATWPTLAAFVATLAACGGGALPDTTTDAIGAKPLSVHTSRPNGDVTRTYYVDSAAGNDANDGNAASAGSGGVGPWRTLGRLTNATLNPGDSVKLLCGSTWNETLRIPASGTATAPITVSSYPATNCARPPAIDGSTAIAPTAWSLYKGSIYKAPLASTPLLLTTSNGTLTLAHHPNRGFDSTQPNSLYVRNAVDSDNVLLNGAQRSTYVTAGSDLVLPKGVTITPGTTVRIRTNAWIIDESAIASVSGSRLNLATPTSSPVTAGWGFYLLGQLWMLDSPGEFFYDAAARIVYLWAPTSGRPTATVYAAALDTGVDAQSRSYLVFDGIAIRNVGTAVKMRGSSGLIVRNARIQDVASIGIDASGSVGGRIEASSIVRTGSAAISGAGDTASPATDLQVVNNTITSAGVLMNGDAMIGLPSRSPGAVLSGIRSTVTGNALTDAGYDGIVPMSGSTVSANTVYGACSALDDGGAIYTSGANNDSLISGNVVVHARGAVEGKPAAVAVTQAQGIYLDEFASGVTVSGNVVTDTDNGIQLHIANGNTIQANTLYGNRKSQLWLQETSNQVNVQGDVFGNLVTDNQIAATTSAARGIFLQTQIHDTYHFGQFDRNDYLDRVFARVATEESPSGSIDYTFAGWTSAKLPDGTPRHLDANGTAASLATYAPAMIAGSNIVPNGNLASDAAGWSAWNQSAPFGTLSRQACTLGFCAAYASGASQGLVSTPNFSIAKGQWYRVSVDIQTGTEGQPINMLVRRGGGGSNGYEPLSTVYFTGVGSRTPTRYTFTLQASATVTAGDPVTLDKGARLDIEHIQPGQTIAVTNVEITPIMAVDSATTTALLLNTASTPAQTACPTANSAPSQCSLFVRLSDGAAVAWPYTLAARSGAIVYTLDPQLLDSDGDGIADAQDRCPATPPGKAANSSGCAIGQ